MFPLVEGQTRLGPSGRYRFLARLGWGTFALILKALDEHTNTPVAIKCMQEPGLNAIGEREAELLRRLNARDPRAHVAIVRALGAFVEQGHYCVVLELLDAPIIDVGAWGPWRQARPPVLGSVDAPEPQHKLLALLRRERRRRLQVEGEQRRQRSDQPQEDEAQAGALAVVQSEPLSLCAIRQITMHLCGALAFLHDNGLIHADLKPENVLHTIESSPAAPATGKMQIAVRLADFGNCIERRQIPLYAADDVDQRGFDIQTLAYRAPEVAMGLAITPAMDMWSLGCVLVECATGRPLFASEDGDAASGTALTDVTELIAQIEGLLTDGQPLEDHVAFYATVARRPQTNPQDTTMTRPLGDVLRRDDPEDPEWTDFVDFVEKLLALDPRERLSARTAFLEPFLQPCFPFQVVFAPSLSPESAPIDTIQHVEPRRPSTSKRKRTSSATIRVDETATQRHGLREALKLIPSAPQAPARRVRKKR